MSGTLLSSPVPSTRSSSPETSTSSAFPRLGRPLSVLEQPSDISSLRPNADPDELPTVLIGNKRYSREEHISKKRPRGGWVKDHGIYLVLMPEKKNTFWLCRRCDEKCRIALYDAQATNGASKHLKRVHNAVEDEEEVL